MTSTLTAPSPSVIDRLNAARALLGCVQIEHSETSNSINVATNDFNVISESDTSTSSTMSQHSNAILTDQINSSYSSSNSVSPSTSRAVTRSPQNYSTNTYSNTQIEYKHNWQKALLDLKQSHEKKIASSASTTNRSGGLDALAMLAFSATVADSNSDGVMDTDDYRENRGNRARSVSCPEGMEKWNRYLPPRQIADPSISTILEDDHYAMNDVDMIDDSNDNTPLDPSSCKLPVEKWGKTTSGSFDVDDLNSVAMSICSFANRTESRRPMRTPSNSYGNLTMMDEVKSNPTTPPSSATQTPVVESPTELLRRTRARLLEDLHEGNGSEKGTMNMPHMLHKYKEMYNKNGRIGIYTPNERAAIIAKFNSKRTRRVWNKKIRYNCRKNLADRRVRVKGRFVKRSSEEAAAAAAAKRASADAKKNITEKESQNAVDQDSKKTSTPPGSVQTSISTSPSPSPTPGSLPTVSESETTDVNDDIMDNEVVSSKDINMDENEKEDAGFLEPTEDQPFRRTRRYTIT